MTNLPQEKATVLQYIESQKNRFSDFHQQIWLYAEPAWREYRSAKAYCDLLHKEGFDIEEGSGGMPTAFVARYGRGKPVLGAYAEYDAVPGNSQQQTPYPAPRQDLHPWAAGHTDPHSALGTSALMGVLGAKAAMEKHKLQGTLVLFGEPAEKVCGSKPIHAAKGYYDGFDAFIAFHPHATNTAVWDTHCGSYWSCVFTFECLEPEKWVDERLLAAPAHPHSSPRCPGAIDALCLMYTNTKYTKEAIYSHTGSWTLNEFIMAGGQCTSDNLPPRFSQIQYAWRSPTLEIQQRVYNVLEANAKHAAQVTGCAVSVQWVSKTRIGLPNRALAELTYRNLELVGPPTYSRDAVRFAQAIQKNLGLPPGDNPFTDASQQLTTPQEYEAQLRQQLPPWQKNFTSDDYVEYTWHAPTVRLLTSRPSLKSPTPGHQYPAWVRNALGGVASCIDPGMFVGGKSIAATLVDLLTQPDALAKAQAEFKERTGGGVGGKRWVAPLLPKDITPPVDLRWPEYIETPRGREWWIPTPTAASTPL
jgi:aminobenzoyl-glutamate utilization protein B